MKKSRFRNPFVQIWRSSKGFALIATISLMVLLALVATALLQLATISLRISRQEQYSQEARDKARFGLQIAIAQLQAELGPDQRVSASSGILDTNPNSPKIDGVSSPHILGVWDSWDNWLNAKHTTKNLSIEQTYDKGRQKLFRRWLISDPQESKLSSIKGVVGGGLGENGSNKVKLLGAGTLGDSAQSQDYIYAGLIPAPSRPNNPGNFAWWISGENQKARINLANETSTNPSEIQASSWNTPRPAVEEISSLSQISKDNDTRLKLISQGTAALSASNSGKASGTPWFHSATTYSEGLFTDVRDGGMKKDLNMLLQSEALPANYQERSSGHAGIRPMSSDLKSFSPAIANRPFASWQHLKEWGNLYNKEQVNNLADSDTARLHMGSGGVYTKVASDAASNITSWQDNRGTYMRFPIVVKMYYVFGLIVEPNDQKTYDCSLTYTPVYVWWNPYSVDLRIDSDKLAAHSLPYKNLPLQLRDFLNGVPERNWTQKEFNQGSTQTDIYNLGRDFGNAFRNSNTGGEIVFKPGELRIFTLGQGRTAGNATNPFVAGFRPEIVSGYKVRIYSNKKSGSTGDNSRDYMGNFKFSVRLTNYKDGTGAGEKGNARYWQGNAGSFTLSSGVGILKSSDGAEVIANPFPQRYFLDWFNDQEDGQVIFSDAKFDISMTEPFFVGAVGLTMKGASKLLQNGSFNGKDFRTKSWLHSSPAFWGSSSYDPNDLIKTYHPMEMQFRQMSGGLDLTEITPHSGINGYWGTGDSGGERIVMAPVSELPLYTPYSLAGFSGFRLTPGWYSAGKSNSELARRFAYQSGVPGIGIGNSFADPMIPGNKVYQRHSISKSDYGDEHHLDDFWDHALLANDAVFDPFFTSSLGSRPRSLGTSTMESTEQLLKKILSSKTKLSNSRFSLRKNGYSDSTISSEISSTEGYKKVANYLVNEGAFNINSSSIDALTAVLKGLRERQLITRAGGSNFTPVGKKQNSLAISRFGTALGDKEYNSPITGVSLGGKNGWSDLRYLSDAQLKTLAEDLMVQIKQRGPFLNMSEVVNRRLSNDQFGQMGALQAAIDSDEFKGSSTINKKFKTRSFMSAGKGFQFQKAESGSVFTGIPGYVVQSDILSVLGNSLTTRDDTFVIRSYGQITGKNGKKILAQAWCEAVVQRSPEYMSAENANEEAMIQRDQDGNPKQNSQLDDLNKVLGRKFRIVSFRWLTPDEV